MLYPLGTFTRIILPTIAFLRSSLAVKVRGAYPLKMRAATAPNLPGEPAHQTTHTRGDCHDRSEAGASVLLFGLAGLGIGHAMLQSAREVQAAPSQGYVLGPNGGEHLVHFRNPGNIFINVSPAKGSDNLAFGTPPVPVGAGIPIHRHFQMDEAFYILEGSGTFILNDARHPIEKGGTIFIPKNAWHGASRIPIRNCCCFGSSRRPAWRASSVKTCNPPGVPRKQLTKDQVNEIARKYATE